MQVTIREVSSRQFNPRDIISGGGASVGVWGMLWMLLRDPGTVLGLLCSTGHSHGSATLQVMVPLLMRMYTNIAVFNVWDVVSTPFMNGCF